MTIDVNVQYADEAFLEDIDEIIEETMIQLFILQPKDIDQLDIAKAVAKTHAPIFYVCPLSLRTHRDEKCVGYHVESADALQDISEIDKVLFVDESRLDDTMIARLSTTQQPVVVMDATHTHDDLQRSFIAIGPNNIDSFEADALASMDMDRMVLQSAYPDFDFDEIHTTVKQISDILLRPEQSIIARATKSSLGLFDLNRR